MIEFFCPILEHFCPFQYNLPGLVSFCQDGVSFCPEYHHEPLIYTQPSQTPFRDIYEQETLPAPPQNTPFPGLILKVGKNIHS